MSSFRILDSCADDSPEKRELVTSVMSEIELAKLEDKPATLASFGVESLHIIRDLYGSELTSEILRKLAALLEDNGRRGSTLGWIEDSRVIVVLTQCDLENGTAICNKLIADIQSVEMRAGGHRIKLVPNIGLAHTQHSSDFSFETLLQVAEEGLEIATSSGGGRAVHTELYEIVQPKAGPRKVRPKVVTPEPKPFVREVVKPAPKHDVFARVVNEQAATTVKPQQRSEPERVTEVSSNVASARMHDRMLEHMLREMFAQGQSNGTSSSVLQEQLIGTVRRWSEESRATLGREVFEEQERELDLLRRRVAKLTEHAEETDAELENLRSGISHVEGLESAFRAVQGLARDDAHFKLKSGIMQQILDANLELHRQIN